VVLVWIFVFVRLIAVPALIVLGFWFLMQLANALAASAGEPGIAFWAHVGGFVLGMLLVPLFRRSGVSMLQPRRSAAFSARRPQRGPWG
jgi:rhomboid family protein